MGTSSEESFEIEDVPRLHRSDRCNQVRNCLDGCSRKTRACCWGTKSRKCACLSIVGLLVVVLSLAIAVASYISNYPVPDFKLRLQRVSLANLCSSNWEFNTTVEVYCSETRASISDISVGLSYQGMAAVSVIVPGSIAQFGWNVYQWSLPTTVYQDALVEKMTRGNLQTLSWSDWHVDLSTTVSLPVMGIVLSKSLHFSLDLGESMVRKTALLPPSPAQNSSSTDNEIGRAHV